MFSKGCSNGTLGTTRHSSFFRLRNRSCSRSKPTCKRGAYQATDALVKERTTTRLNKATVQVLPYLTGSKTAEPPQLLDPLLSNLWAATSSPKPAVLPGYFLVSVRDPPQKNQGKSPDFYANVGDAIRSLREDIPLLFQKDLNYQVYREDIVFKDPRNSFEGLKNYKLIFWSLRFHGNLFFSSLYVDIKRIWQPEETVIKMRWTVIGVPRVPWEAQGIFEGVSEYKLDTNGKIYEHSVANVIMRDPPIVSVSPLLASLNLLPTPQQQPCPGLWFKDVHPSRPTGEGNAGPSRDASWLHLYAGGPTSQTSATTEC